MHLRVLAANPAERFWAFMTGASPHVIGDLDGRDAQPATSRTA
ncbi:hypothetical protein [Georgenia thermotolerans]|nr:hypothetical protein [Georgenia thermotolerans]